MKKALHILLLGFTIAIILSGAMPAEAIRISYSYDDAGRLIGADYGNGRIIRYVYGPSGNLSYNSSSYILSDMIQVMQLLINLRPLPNVSQEADVSGDDRIGLEEAIFILQNLSEIRQ